MIRETKKNKTGVKNRSKPVEPPGKSPKVLLEQPLKDYKRSHSNMDRFPYQNNNENPFKSKYLTDREASQSVMNTAAGSTNLKENSVSPRDHLSDLPDFNFKRRQTMPPRRMSELVETHKIENRQDFEEAVEHVFQHDLASKSLHRSSRLNEGILLDNYVQKRKNSSSKRKREESCENMDEITIRLGDVKHVPLIKGDRNRGRNNGQSVSHQERTVSESSSSADFERCTSIKELKVRTSSRFINVTLEIEILSDQFFVLNLIKSTTVT